MTWVYSSDGTTVESGEVSELPRRLARRVSDGAWSNDWSDPTVYGWYPVTETAAPDDGQVYRRTVSHDGTGFVTEWVVDTAATADKQDAEQRTVYGDRVRLYQQQLRNRSAVYESVDVSSMTAAEVRTTLGTVVSDLAVVYDRLADFVGAVLGDTRR